MTTPSWQEKAVIHERSYQWRMGVGIVLILIGTPLISEFAVSAGIVPIILGGAFLMATQLHDNYFQAQNRKERGL